MQTSNTISDALKSLRTAEIDAINKLNGIQQAIKSLEGTKGQKNFSENFKLTHYPKFVDCSQVYCFGRILK